MNWLNLHTAILDSEEFLGSDPVERGTWLCLQRYCIGQENGGIITDCADWSDRKWQQLVRITKKEVTRSTDLWSWDGETLTVWGYPNEKEAEVQRLRELGRLSSESKRAAAKANGSKGGRPKNNPTENPTGNPTVGFENETQITQRKPIEVEREVERERNKEEDTPPAILPEGWKRLTRAERSRKKVNFNDETMIRIGGWFKQKPETLWTISEYLALQDVSPPEDELQLVGEHYSYEIENNGYRFKAIETLLNNWSAARAKANAFFDENPNLPRP